ncbi:hypothetical protein [Telluria aromaticivorans]|uniref:DUF4426 domain-containing protein n=1 Tax=Telluria aromaticivorans TaxID=2725995 RepID=A0A7Y2NZ44_9BURK|nr:hypothetical protein [Telluria aromaticivorans]NNG22659.1 hypothetical protein [Telluria aromaticivorans]
MHVKRILPLLFLTLGGLVSAVGAVEKDATVRHQLEVETTEGKVRVRLTVENHGESTIYVPREVAAGDELTGRRFEVLDKAGKPLDYTGMMVKRGALTAQDYHPVAPHTMHMNTIDITPAYAFKKGKGSYEIRYDGPWLADVGKLDAVTHSPAVPVRFSFSR